VVLNIGQTSNQIQGGTIIVDLGNAAMVVSLINIFPSSFFFFVDNHYHDMAG